MYILVLKNHKLYKKDCDFIEQNKQLLCTSQKQINEIYKVVELDYKMLREEIPVGKLRKCLKIRQLRVLLLKCH